LDRGLELEADLAVGLPHEKRGERTLGPRGHELQEIRLARREKLLHLVALDRPLQNHASGAEVAGLVRPHGLFRRRRPGSFEHARVDTSDTARAAPGPVKSGASALSSDEPSPKSKLTSFASFR
jgi:hypothetical protein